jgi:hypothetical protein
MGVLLGTRVSELIVASPLFAIRENLISFGALFELFDGLGVARIAIRMIFDRQLAIGRGNVAVGSVALQAKDFVVIAF